MATGWMKSLHCKSRALDDVVPHHQILPNSASCKRGVQSLKDVVETTKERKKNNRKPKMSPQNKRSVARIPEPDSTPPVQRPRSSSASARHARSSSESAFFPTLTELPAGHPSRNIVEIIFHTSWSPKSFSGRVEMLFKVQNLPRTVTRFEEYREAVKKRAGASEAEDGREDHARCVADGNELMRFYCLGPTTAVYETGCSAWGLHAGKGTAICTFAGSGDAHERSGGGRGRRAMLVCRVVAGRVCKEFGINSLIEGRVGFDSVSGDSGELLVFDSRAVLPCFLIIYKL